MQCPRDEEAGARQAPGLCCCFFIEASFVFCSKFQNSLGDSAQSNLALLLPQPCKSALYCT